MATQGKRAPPKRKTSIPVGSFPLPPVSMDANSVREQDWEGLMGWIAACVLVVLMLPLLAWIYIDTLEQRQEVRRQTEQIERLRRKVERKERDKEPESISDNPVFDRRSKREHL